MRNRSEFDIIGRIGRFARVGKVLKINVCANYRRKVDDKWVDEDYWNTITIFNDGFQKRAEKMAVGDLIVARGRIRQNKYERDGEVNYSTDLIADELDVLTPKSSEPT